MENEIKSEALRYLGFGGSLPDDRTAALLDRAVKELREHAAMKYCSRIVTREEAAPLLIGKDINAHIAGCSKVILFAATLGASADTLIRRAEISDMAYAVVLDAAASALTESFCDDAEKEIKASAELAGCGFTWRYSPGYGDYPIAVQSELIRFLQADKRIGLTATESCTLTPRKSVTAVIGAKAGNNGAAAVKRGCETCSMRDNCKFRKDGKSCGQNT